MNQYYQHWSPEVRRGLDELRRAEEIRRNPPTPQPNELATNVARLLGDGSDFIDSLNRKW